MIVTRGLGIGHGTIVAGGLALTNDIVPIPEVERLVLYKRSPFGRIVRIGNGR